MKSIGRLVALLLLLTVFFIRMASEILDFGYSTVNQLMPLLTLFAAVLLLWLAVFVWPRAYHGGLALFAATFNLLFIAVLYVVQYSLDLVAVLCALVLFALNLGKGGETRSGVVIPPTMSGMIVASSAASSGTKKMDHSVVTQKAPATESKGKFVASKRGKFYHKAGSEWAEKIKENNRVWFASKEDAWEAGYKAHKDIE